MALEKVGGGERRETKASLLHSSPLFSLPPHPPQCEVPNPHAYLVTKEAAARLLQAVLPISGSISSLLHTAGSSGVFNAQCVETNVVPFASFDSDRERIDFGFVV